MTHLYTSVANNRQSDRSRVHMLSYDNLSRDWSPVTAYFSRPGYTYVSAPQLFKRAVLRIIILPKYGGKTSGNKRKTGGQWLAEKLALKKLAETGGSASFR